MLVPLASFLNAHEAHIFKRRLAADGVRGIIQSEDFVYMNWSYANAVGGIRICVLSEELEQARITMRKCMNGDYRAELAAELGDLDDLACPVCGSLALRSRSSYADLVLLAASYFLTSIIFPACACVHHCDDCHHQWDEG